MSQIKVRIAPKEFQNLEIGNKLYPEVHLSGKPYEPVDYYNKTENTGGSIILDEYGQYCLTLKQYGVYVFNDITLKVDTIKQYHVSLEDVWSVVIDLTNSDPETACTYTHKAAEHGTGWDNWVNEEFFNAIKPCILKNGEVQYYLDPTDYRKKIDGTASVITGEDGDVVIEIPKVGYRLIREGDNLLVSLTTERNKEGFCYLAHSFNGENDCDFIYIGVYENSVSIAKDGTYQSRYAAATRARSMDSFDTAKSCIENKGEGYQLFSFYPWTLLQVMYLIVFKNLNSENVIGRATATIYGADIGTSISIPSLCSPSNASANKLFGIENLWGSLEQWCDGLNSTDETVQTFFNQNMPYISDMNYTKSGYLTKPIGTNLMGFLPTEDGVNGSSTTYFCDTVIFTKNASAATVGGYGYTNGNVPGIFYTHMTSSNTANKVWLGGSRITYKHLEPSVYVYHYNNDTLMFSNTPMTDHEFTVVQKYVLTPDNQLSTPPWGTNNHTIKKIISNGKVIITQESMAQWFGASSSGFSLDISGMATWDVSRVKNMYRLFANRGIVDLSPLRNWDTSNVTNMAYMFYSWSVSRDIKELASWNVSKVKTMAYMFAGNSLNNTNSLSNWKPLSLINATHMFDNVNYSNAIASSPVQMILNISAWNTPQLQNTSYMFYYSGFTEITGVDNLNVSNVYNASHMFDSCAALESLQLNNWNTSHFINAAYMFNYCRRLLTLEVDQWNTQNIQDASYMFSTLNNMKTLDLSQWNTKNLKKAVRMFGASSNQTGYTSGWTELNLANWDTSNLQDSSEMFQYCAKLTSVDLTGWDPINLQNTSYMFYNCNILANIKGLENWDAKQIKNAYYMFGNCRGLTNLAIEDWNPINLQNASYMFSGCSNPVLNIDISKWHVPALEDATFMFWYCQNMVLGNFTAEKLTNISSMFSYASLANVDLSKMYIPNVSNAASMFAGCSTLKSLDCTNWGWQEQIIDTNRMFFNCTQLKYIVCDYDWNTTSTDTFLNCYSLASNTNNIGYTYDHVNGDMAKVNGGYFTRTLEETLLYTADTFWCLTNDGILSIATDISHLPIDNVRIQGNFNISTSTTQDYSLAPWYSYRSSINTVNILDDIAPISMANWFYACSALTTLNGFEHIYCDKLKYIQSMFCECGALQDFTPLQNLDVSKVVSFDRTFYNCRGMLDTEAFKSWHTDSLNTMQYTFYGCTALTDVSGLAEWNTSQVTNMNYTFSADTAITNLSTLEKWDVSKVTSHAGIFSGITSTRPSWGTSW